MTLAIRLLLHNLSAETADNLYKIAMDLLHAIQHSSTRVPQPLGVNIRKELRITSPSPALRAPSPRARGEGENEGNSLGENMQLPQFDKQFILYELNVFKEWFLQAYLKIALKAQEEMLLHETFHWLSNEISQQPQVVIHRDYHSRNIMLISNGDSVKLGIIDFQDAMYGPFTYDLVSLLKDCYIQWPREQIMGWVSLFPSAICSCKTLSFTGFYSSG